VGFAVAAIAFVRCCAYWRNFRRFLFGIACFVTLIALLYAEENWRGKRAWEKHRREWEAKGEKFTLAALAPPAVPDEKNFARAPLFQADIRLQPRAGGCVCGTQTGWRILIPFALTLPSRRDANDKLVLGSLEKGTLRRS
jgi:hypothetical protein